MNENILYFGLDLSLRSSGIVAVDKLYGVHFSGNTKQFGKLRGTERLLQLRNYFKNIIKKYKSSAGDVIVAIEDYAYGARGRGIFNIGELGGIIKLLLYDMNIRTIIISSTALKKYATGKGNIKKKEVPKYVKKQWGKEFDTGDEADAFILAIMCAEYVAWRAEGFSPGQIIAMADYQREVIQNIKG